MKHSLLATIAFALPVAANAQFSAYLTFSPRPSLERSHRSRLLRHRLHRADRLLLVLRHRRGRHPPHPASPPRSPQRRPPRLNPSRNRRRGLRALRNPTRRSPPRHTLQTLYRDRRRLPRHPHHQRLHPAGHHRNRRRNLHQQIRRLRDPWWSRLPPHPPPRLPHRRNRSRPGSRLQLHQGHLRHGQHRPRRPLLRKKVRSMLWISPSE